MADYFTEHLMGDRTERSTDITEIVRELEQSGTKSGAGGRRPEN
jgi:hypothetical protein